jgi:glycosyltransferase involved in cell wall biosynthesis/predicted RNA methylase
MRIVFVANAPIPYHTPIFNALSEIVDLHVLYMARDERINQFRDVWGTAPHYAYSFYGSKSLLLQSVDLRMQLSVGVSRRLAALNPDVVAFISWHPIVIEPLLWARSNQVPVVMWGESYLSSGLFRGRVSTRLRRWIVGGTDAFVTNGSRATEYLVSLGADGEQVVTSRLPSSLPVEGVVDRHAEERPTFLFVGRLISRKRPLEVVDAFNEVRRSVPDARLVVVGQGPLELGLRSRVRDDPHVEMLGHVEGPALSGVYDRADVLVLPARREVWGLVVNEALAHGLFVVASDEVGAARDLLNDSSGIVVPVDDRGALVDAMERAAEAPSAATDRRKRAQRVADCTPMRFAADLSRAATIAAGEQPASGAAASTVADEERMWSAVVANLPLQQPRLVSVSRWTPDSRVYASASHVAIVRRGSTPASVNALETAASIWQRLGVDATTTTTDGWHVLKLPRVPGVPLDQQVGLSLLERFRIVGDVGRELSRLHRRGIAHCDVRPDNILVDGHRVSLIDYDQAFVTTAKKAAIADWVGLSRRGASPNPYWKFAVTTLAPRAFGVGRRARAAVLRRGPTWIEPQETDKDLRLLARAWRIAERSPANAPGQRLGYYAMTYRGYHFPGERPWYLRWEPIKQTVEFEGKSVVELGCNMGLLSTFATLHGASQATGVDGDRDIVRAARIVGRALGGGARFEIGDLTDRATYDDLPEPEIVCALSVVQWLEDDRPLLDYLRRAPEVIFEGHRAVEIEERVLHDLGFTHVERVLRTERGRFVLHGRKSDGA